MIPIITLYTPETFPNGALKQLRDREFIDPPLLTATPTLQGKKILLILHPEKPFNLPFVNYTQAFLRTVSTNIGLYDAVHIAPSNASWTGQKIHTLFQRIRELLPKQLDVIAAYADGALAYNALQDAKTALVDNLFLHGPILPINALDYPNELKSVSTIYHFSTKAHDSPQGIPDNVYHFDCSQVITQESPDYYLNTTIKALMEKIHRGELNLRSSHRYTILKTGENRCQGIPNTLLQNIFSFFIHLRQTIVHIVTALVNRIKELFHQPTNQET